MKPLIIKIKRQCCSCEKLLTSRNVKVIGTTSLGLWYNCPDCHTTLIKREKLTVDSQIRVGNNVFKGFFNRNSMTA